MIFYMQMRWNIEDRLRLDEVWDLEIEEAKAAQDGSNSSPCTRWRGRGA